ncbi:MAG: UDP-N-acetylmuramoyl-L-alanine--D-glutamate ligase [Acidimicrobiia bacterium]
MTRVLILGSGVSGMAAARLARRVGMTVTLFDESASTTALEEGFSLSSGVWDAGLLTGIDIVVASPGFSERSLPVVETLESGVPIWSEVEFAWRHINCPVVAITGTNGKTSVTEATSMMMEASGIDAPATGNIGAPLSDFVVSEHDALVVEVSSFQLRFCEEFHPVAAAITNVAIDHLDWHGSEHGYRSAKANIYRNQTSADLLVYDADDPGATALAGSAHAELYPVSGSRNPGGGGGVDDGVLAVGEMVVDLAEIPSNDPTHLSNLAAASALAMRMGASAEDVGATARRFGPGPHRRSVVYRGGGVTWIDDSKATNPHAAIASIRANDSVVLIAGGKSKGLDVAPIGREPNIRVLLGIGEAGNVIADAAGDRGRFAGTLELAVEMAAQVATPGDTVLLAPGCASFDQFESYGARGDRFVELVHERMGASRT